MGKDLKGMATSVSLTLKMSETRPVGKWFYIWGKRKRSKKRESSNQGMSLMAFLAFIFWALFSNYVTPILSGTNAHSCFLPTCPWAVHFSLHIPSVVSVLFPGEQQYRVRMHSSRGKYSSVRQNEHGIPWGYMISNSPNIIKPSLSSY